MNQKGVKERAQILACLCEGNSIRATARLTSAAINTVVSLLVQTGQACAKLHDERVRGVKSERVQCDEIWSFCYAKQKNVPRQLQGKFGFGDVWTWTAIDADTKLMVDWYVGTREVESACIFMAGVRARLANRVQLSTDGHRAYLRATEQAFNWDVDYAMLEKHYGTDPSPKTQARYSPAKLQSIKVRPICGHPDPDHISTSFSERQNLTMRMSMRRFTRLTNAFSKKIENHCAAIAMYFVYYNFCRVHQTLRCTPAMQAGLTERIWTLEEIASLPTSSN